MVTDRIPTEREMEDMKFAMKVVKHIKSNGIVLAKDGRTIGVGPGQTNRIWAIEIPFAGQQRIQKVRYLLPMRTSRLMITLSQPQKQASLQ